MLLVEFSYYLLNRGSPKDPQGKSIILLQFLGDVRLILCYDYSAQ